MHSEASQETDDSTIFWCVRGVTSGEDRVRRRLRQQRAVGQRWTIGQSIYNVTVDNGGQVMAEQASGEIILSVLAALFPLIHSKLVLHTLALYSF